MSSYPQTHRSDLGAVVSLKISSETASFLFQPEESKIFIEFSKPWALNRL